MNQDGERAKRAKARVPIRDFPGLMLNVDPDDMPPGAAAEQVNMASSRIGELELRPGYRPVNFEDSQ